MKETIKVLFADAFSAAHVGNGVLLLSSLKVFQDLGRKVTVEALAQRMDSLQEITDIPYSNFLFHDFPVGKSAARKILWLAVIGVPFLLVHVLNQYTLKLPISWLALSRQRKHALQKIEEADVLVSITGEAINDSFRHVLPFFLFVYWLGGKRGKKVIIFPQSIGPLNRSWTRALVGYLFRRCTLVAARDEVSLEELKQLRLPEGLMAYSPDVGIAQPFISREEARQVLAGIGFELSDAKTTIAVTASFFTEEGISIKNYLEILKNSLLFLAGRRELQILIMPANMPLDGCGAGDYEAGRTLYEQLHAVAETHILPVAIYSPAVFKGIQSLMDLVVSSRMHAAILSTMAGTPTITLNTQRKLLGFMKNINQAEYSLNLDELSEELLIEKIEQALNAPGPIRQKLAAARQRLEGQLAEFGARVGKILDSCTG